MASSSSGSNSSSSSMSLASNRSSKYYADLESGVTSFCFKYLLYLCIVSPSYLSNTRAMIFSRIMPTIMGIIEYFVSIMSDILEHYSKE